MSKRPVLPRYRLTNGQDFLPGASSYRATLQAQLVRLTQSSHQLSDEQWFNLLANTLNTWFTFEREFIHSESQTLIEVLSAKGLLKTGT